MFWKIKSGWLWLFFLNWIFFYFNPSTLILLEIDFHILFWFTFYRVIIISWLGMRIDRLTRVDPNRSLMLLSQCLWQNLILNIYFKSNYIFTDHLDYFWTHQDNWITSDQFQLWSWDWDNPIESKSKQIIKFNLYSLLLDPMLNDEIFRSWWTQCWIMEFFVLVRPNVE
jgi:hypothetical protein